MPFILIVVGLILLVTAIKGTTGRLGTMLAEDTFGAGGFVYWFVAIMVVGAIGYIKAFKTLSDAFIVLIVLSLVLSHRGVFKQFNDAIKSIKVPTATTPGVGVKGNVDVGFPSIIQ